MSAVLVNAIHVGLGGFAGSVLRYLAGVVVAGCGLWQPLATFGVNALGALMLGAILACGAAGQGGAVARHLLAIGFCGGFTTFSTFSAEVLQLLRAQQHAGAIAYAAASLATSVLCVWVGWVLAERFVGRI
jgi:CrcB protein